MAANTYRTSMTEIRFGQDGVRVELWTVDLNSASAAQVNTSFTRLLGAQAVRLGTSGAANSLSVVGTVDGNGGVPLTNGTVGVEYTGTSVDKFLLTLYGR